MDAAGGFAQVPVTSKLWSLHVAFAITAHTMQMCTPADVSDQNIIFDGLTCFDIKSEPLRLRKGVVSVGSHGTYCRLLMP
jgi:hypothetical protein